jgi:hypothetical protein
MWTRIARPTSVLRAQHFFNQLYPDEPHNVGGDCMNPKCDYKFTPEDFQEMETYSGWFTCPQCGWTYNYLAYGNDRPGGYTRSGLTMTQMGSIGENIVVGMGSIPGVGQILEITDTYQHPLDAIVGPYGCEIKTNHSEAQPRFKIGGEPVMYNGQRVSARQAKIMYCHDNNLIPALIGVRLNFYTDKADVFFRQGMSDTWIGGGQIQHVGTVDFRNLNPFPDPTDVPPPSQLPEDDTTPSDADIPF